MGNHKIHLVSHFHYDVVYRRTYKEYLRISLDNLIEMLNIYEKNSEYTFLIEQVILIKEFWNAYPEFRDKLKKLAEEGRLEIACGMYVMPDMSLSNGESLIQQAYSGKKWVKENLGLDVKVCWIADCWNHHRQIPQIMKVCGYNYYAFSRSMRTDLKQITEFYWKGIDGTKILTHWMVIGYDGFAFSREDELKYVKQNLKTLKRKLSRLEKHASTNIILLPSGRDFMKPQQIAPLIVKKWNEKNPDKKIKFSTSLNFFKDVEKSKNKLPVYPADFAPTYQGTNSAHIEIKQWNRRLENKINTAEKLNVITLQFKDNDSREELDKIWEIVLLNQFHDIICGSINDESFREVITRYKEVDCLLDKLISQKMDILGKQISIKEKNDIYLLVFNPSSHNRLDIIEYEIAITEDNIKGLRVFDGSKEIVSQITDCVYELRNGKKHLFRTTLLFISEIPSLGYKVFKIVKTKEEIKYPNEFVVSGNRIENKFYKITISKSGTVSSLIMKDTQEEFVYKNKPFFNNLVYQPDEGDFWTCYKRPSDGGIRTTMLFDDPMPETGNNIFYSHNGKNKLEIIEKGPVRVTIKVTGKLKNCKFTQYAYIYNNIKRIDFRTLVLPEGKHYRLRVCFPANIEKGKIRYEIPFGIQERGEGEYIAQNWIDYSDNKKGLCILNQGLPGNNVTGGIIMLSLFRAVNYEELKGMISLPSSDGFGIGLPHIFRYSIVPFSKEDNSYKPYHFGEDFNSPLIPGVIEISNGKLPLRNSFVGTSQSNAVISSIIARDKKILIRLYEAEGKKTNAQLELGLEIKGIKKYKWTLNKFKIKTINIGGC